MSKNRTEASKTFETDTSDQSEIEAHSQYQQRDAGVESEIQRTAANQSHFNDTLNENSAAAAQLGAVAPISALKQQIEQMTVKTRVEAFEAGDADALCELARWGLDGQISGEMLRQIIENECVTAGLVEIARRYAQGLCAPDGDEEAYILYNQLEILNDPDILCALARTYNFGWGVEKDVAKAINYYVKAADAGSCDSLDRLTLCQATRTNAQIEAAIRHFKLLASSGELNALFNTAWCCFNRFGTHDDTTKAAELLQIAADCGCTNAMVLLSEFYKCGYDVEKDESMAFELCKQAADEGNRDGMYQLAMCYEDGVGVDESQETAAFWLAKAAECGHTQAASELGRRYLIGGGVQPDLATAMRYYEQAALAGDMHAQCDLGNFCRNVVKSPQSRAKADYWHYRMDQQREDDSEDDLEVESEDESDKCADCNEANSRFAARAETDAGNNISSDNTSNSAVDSVQRRAFLLAKLAAERGCREAFSVIGECFFSGRAVARDWRAAARNYERAHPTDTATLQKLLECYASGETDGNELNMFSTLQRMDAALRTDINSILRQVR